MPKKPPASENVAFSHLAAEDMHALESIRRGNDWLRAALCTLARRGIAFRKQYPERASEILMILAPLPYFKAGQFLFDLMEWEDFMLEGPEPPAITTVLDARALKRLTSLLNVIRAEIDGSRDQTEEVPEPPQPFGRLLQVEISSLIVDDRQLPPLEAGFYLYRDVVLGLYISAVKSRQSAAPMPLPDAGKPEKGTATPTSSGEKDKRNPRARPRATGSHRERGRNSEEGQ